MISKRPPLGAGGGNLNAQGAKQQKPCRRNTIKHEWSQPEKLLAALQAGPVTTPEAIYEMLIPHPAGTIHRLRLQGHDIRTELRPALFPDCEIRWAAEYSLLTDGAEA